MKTLKRIRLLPLLALGLAAGCADLTGSIGSDVVALTIEDQFGNTLVSVDPAGIVSGSITVPRNGQRTLNTQLRSTGGVVEPGTDETVRITITNSTLVSWNGSRDGSGILTAGPAAGSTTMRIDLISAGTAVYTSPLIPVQVT